MVNRTVLIGAAGLGIIGIGMMMQKKTPRVDHPTTSYLEQISNLHNAFTELTEYGSINEPIFHQLQTNVEYLAKMVAEHQPKDKTVWVTALRIRENIYQLLKVLVKSAPASRVNVPLMESKVDIFKGIVANHVNNLQLDS